LLPPLSDEQMAIQWWLNGWLLLLQHRRPKFMDVVS
jgi:hypothetical protein